MLYCYIQTDSTVKRFEKMLWILKNLYSQYLTAIFCVRKESKELYRITFLYNLITAARQIINIHQWRLCIREVSSVPVI